MTVSLLIVADDRTAAEVTAHIRTALMVYERHLTYLRQPIPTVLQQVTVTSPAAGLASRPSSPWLTLDQAATYANVSTRTLARWRADGLPTRGTPGRPLIHRDDLDTYLTETPVDSFGPNVPAVQTSERSAGTVTSTHNTNAKEQPE